jgi:HTH-type transcriptional regulator/antitoxin MqsA
MKCPNCEQDVLVHDIRTVPYTYKGKTILVDEVAGDYCNFCKEIIHLHDPDCSERINAFRAEVDASPDAPAYVRHARIQLGLSREEAGELLGGDGDAFARYESGEDAPPTALVKLLGLLERRPELLDELRTA